jgi:hypothetical protein
MNPFDLKAARLAKHAQHPVIIHFPIALFVISVAFREGGFHPPPSNLLFFDTIQGISHPVSSLEVCRPEYRRSYKQQPKVTNIC